MLVAAVGAGVAYAMNRQTALMHIVQGAGLIVVLEAFITFPTIPLSNRNTELARFRERAGWMVFGVFWLLGFMTLVYGLLQAAGGA